MQVIKRCATLARICDAFISYVDCLESWIIRLDKTRNYRSRFQRSRKIYLSLYFCPDVSSVIASWKRLVASLCKLSHESTVVKTCNDLRSCFIKVKDCFQVQAEWSFFQDNYCCVQIEVTKIDASFHFLCPFECNITQ